MTCIHATSTLDQVIRMVEECAIASGGPNWPNLAVVGLGVIAAMAVVFLAVYILIRSVR